MESPINQFEIVESIRFFASLVGTEGVSEIAKQKANLFIERLVDSLETSVNNMTARSTGLITN